MLDNEIYLLSDLIVFLSIIFWVILYISVEIYGIEYMDTF